MDPYTIGQFPGQPAGLTHITNNKPINNVVSPIDQATSTLAVGLDILTDELHGLFNRLSGLINPSTPAPASNRIEAPSEGTSMLAAQLISYNAKLQDLICAVRSVKDRLEV